MSRILVTGGCGFVGSPVCRQLLRDGHSVYRYDNLSRVSPNCFDDTADPSEMFEGDVRDEATVSKILNDCRIDVVIHLAAMHFIPDCNRDPESCISNNVLGTISVLNAVRHCASVKSLLFASTAAVYRPSAEAHHEDSTIGPTDIYGMTKLVGEQLVQSLHRETGMPLGIMRLFNVYGPGETNPHLIPAIINQARRGPTLRLGDLSTARDYVFTEDVASCVSLVVDAVADGKMLTCNVGTGVARSGIELVAAIGQAMGVEAEVVTDEARLRPSERPVLCADVSRAKSLLSWRPMVDFADGLSAAVEDAYQWKA